MCVPKGVLLEGLNLTGEASRSRTDFCRPTTVARPHTCLCRSKISGSAAVLMNQATQAVTSHDATRMPHLNLDGRGGYPLAQTLVRPSRW